MNQVIRAETSELTFYAELINQHNHGKQQRHGNTQPANELLDKLDYHGITLLALENTTLDTEVVNLIGARKVMMIANEALKKNALIELLNAFDSANLKRHIIFKGSALAYSLYPNPWLRPRTDSDCLINENDFSAYNGVFENLGYQKLFAVEGKLISYQSTFSKKLAGDSVINLDLHWRINNRQILANAYTVDELILEGKSLYLDDAKMMIPSNADNLLISCLHRLGHHHTEERLAWLNDINLLANVLSANEWQSLLEKASIKQISAITLDALTLCVELFNTNFPDKIKEKMLEHSQQKELSQIFLRRNLPEWKYFYYEILAMKSWEKRLMLLKENILPSPSYVRQQMQTKFASLAYLKRFWRGIKRIT